MKIHLLGYQKPPLSLRQICSLMRGGIAERGGIRVGHRIIEINGQSVVATPHDKIIQILTNAVGEVNSNTPIDFTSSKCTGEKLRPLFLFLFFGRFI